MDLSGKTCLITGASSGLGLAVAKRFAAERADTVMLCRTEEEGRSAIDEVKREIPGAPVRLVVCDLASMSSIRGFIEAFRENDAKLDLLFNNAAVMKRTRTLTEDGFEMMFQVNYLAPFILMNSFVELLKKGSLPQVIGNGRPADKLRLEMDDLQFSEGYSMYNSFFKTKLCLLFACMEYARRHEADGITTLASEPGPFKSGLVREVPIVGWFKNLFSVPVEAAAERMMRVFTADIPKNGKVFKEGEEYPLMEYWKDREVATKLWSVTESLLNDKIRL